MDGWTWTTWILLVLASGFMLEAYALVRGKLTLSRYTWRASLAWGPLPFVIGVIVGCLATHFWWHWCPELGSTNGFLLPSFVSPANASERDLSLPDPVLTPGKWHDLSADEICSTRWGKDARHVTPAMKKLVFARYGLAGNSDPACIPDAHGRRCEVDHLIPRELGGLDHVSNLWPQPYGAQPWNAKLKDRLENKLHKEVCVGNLDPDEARASIRLDWRRAYIEHFGKPTGD